MVFWVEKGRRRKKKEESEHEQQGRKMLARLNQPLIGLGKADKAVGFDKADKVLSVTSTGLSAGTLAHHVALPASARPTSPYRPPPRQQVDDPQV